MPWVVTAVVHLTEPLPARLPRPHKRLLNFKTAAIPAKWQQISCSRESQKRCDKCTYIGQLNAVKVQLRFPFFFLFFPVCFSDSVKCDEVVVH